MRKLLLLMAGALLAGASAEAKLQMYLGETPVEPGNVTFNNYTTEDWGTATLYVFKPELMLVSDKATTITAEAKAYNGQEIEFCLDPVVGCVSKPVVTVSDFPLEANKKVEMQFHYSIVVCPEDELEDWKEMSTNVAADALPTNIKTTLTITEEGGSPLVYDVIFNADDSGVNSIQSTDSLTSVIYNLNGIKIADNASNLPAGIYIVKNGSKIQKVMVK